MSAPTDNSKTIVQANRKLGLLLAIVVVSGLCFAAVRAWGWKEVVRPRNLIVVGPDEASLMLSGSPKQLSVTDGVYAWSVLPGPYTLTVTQPNQKTSELQIRIPAGLGGLMLEVQTDKNGDFILGYF